MMLQDVRTAMERSRYTLWRDMVGMAALGLSFYAVLHVPQLLSAV